MASHDPIMRAVGSVLKEHFQAIANRLRGIDARLDSMPVNLADIYRGTHKDGEIYRRGELLTHSGGLWLAMKDTAEKPGSTSDWRLIVKRGDVK